MQIAFHIMIVGEIVGINLITLHFCSRPRYSAVRTALCLTLFSIPIFFLGFMVSHHFSFNGNDNGLFVLLAFLYLLPAQFLYRDSQRSIFILLCAVWSYTLSIFSISVQMAHRLPHGWFTTGTFMLQSLFFLITSPFFIHFMRRFYRPMLDHTDYKTRRLLQYTGVLWFITILLVHFTFVMGYGVIIGSLCVALLMANAVVAHFLLYRIVSSAQSLRSLQHEVYLDSLTGLRNRRSLFADLERLIKLDMRFTLFYFDLDHFKYVNDSEGHLAGDRYLQCFAQVTSDFLAQEGSLMYRIAGDEFGAVYTGDNPSALARELQAVNTGFPRYYPAFQGVSIGMANYPQCKTPEELLKWADQNMYLEKQAHIKDRENQL